MRESRGGVVLESFVARDLADAMIALLADSARLLEARRNGRIYVEQQHAPEPFRRRLGAILEEVGDA